MKILNENVSRNIMKILNESARNKWQIPENLKVVDINMTNDPHGTCMGKFNDGTWFVSSNGSIGIYDADPAGAYGFNNEYDEDYYIDNADEIVEDFNNNHLLAGFEADFNNYENSNYNKLQKLIYKNK